MIIATNSDVWKWKIYIKIADGVQIPLYNSINTWCQTTFGDRNDRWMKDRFANEWFFKNYDDAIMLEVAWL